MDFVQPQPLYLQLKNILIEKITLGIYPLGTCLPSERALEEISHLSRGSIRKALESLEEEGYIRKSANRRAVVLKPGKKTFRLLGFASSSSRSGALDVYLSYFEALLFRCNQRGDYLYYLDLSSPLPKTITEVHFDAVFAESNNHELLRKVGKLAGKPPVIALNFVRENSTVRTVGTNNAAGGRMAAEYLISKGYRKLLFMVVRTAYRDLSFQQRRDSFLASAAEHQIPCRLLEVPDPSFDTAEKYFRREISVHRPDAVFTATDNLAVPVLKVLYADRIHVPDEMAVMGFDGREIGRYLSPALTSVEQPAQKIAEVALQWLDTNAFSGVDLYITPRILEMESVGFSSSSSPPRKG